MYAFCFSIEHSFTNMSATEQFLIAFATLTFPPLLFLVVLIIILASLGTSLGIRQKYVELLLWIFEFGRQKIEHAKKRKNSLSDTEEENNVNVNGTYTVINKEITLTVPPTQVHSSIPKNRSYNTLQREFHLSDAYEFIKAGVEAIIEDDVTQRFAAEELQSWNLLTRTNKNYQFLSVRLTIFWGVGFAFRYCVLFPVRCLLTIIGIGWLIISTAFIGYIPEGRIKKHLNNYVSLMCHRILSRTFSAVVTYHNKENRAKSGGICVANHTTPIDVVILSCDNSYALVGQTHGGLLGLLQRSLARSTAHIWFERSEIKDRFAVAKRLSEHVEDSEKLPILIFPEGTCINNTSVMMFKKGSFEIANTIYPVAIKYDRKFGDAFWDSSKQTMMQYLLMMMTSWAIVCNVWYLPPMIRQENEAAIDFASRVKAEIAKAGGLVDLDWDGQLKRMRAKSEWKLCQQEEFSRRIKLE